MATTPCSLATMRESLKLSGRLVLMERIAPQELGGPREQQTKTHHLEMALAVAELRAAGFTIVERVPDFSREKALGANSYWLVAATPTLRR